MVKKEIVGMLKQDKPEVENVTGIIIQDLLWLGYFEVRVVADGKVYSALFDANDEMKVSDFVEVPNDKEAK